MIYCLDTEFLEGTQRTFFGKSKPTIDLISIGLVSEDGREFYAISKDFNLKEAWNRYDLKPDIDNGGMKKVYWIRENVLENLFNNEKYNHYKKVDTFEGFKNLVNHFGKTNKQIAEEVKMFVGFPNYFPLNAHMRAVEYTKPEFYGYYCDYDWVVFCWLFGKMIDLPKGFPMYCRDLKQTFDEKQKIHGRDRDGREIDLKKTVRYPKQANEHNALDDARFNFELYKFLEKL
jgi:hypothetical protein